MIPAAAEGQVRATISRWAGVIRGLVEAQRRSALAVIAAAAFSLFAGIYLAVHRGDASHLRAAVDATASGSPDEALREAERISRRPAESHALVLRAQALESLGRRHESLDIFARAADGDPRNWKIRRDWAIALAKAGRRRQAGQQMAVALALNPRLELPPGFRR